MNCAPPPLPADSQSLRKGLSTKLLERREREGENEIIVTITLSKAAVSKNHKTGLRSGVWPGWLATTCPAFLCDTVLCHFLHCDCWVEHITELPCDIPVWIYYGCLNGLLIIFVVAKRGILSNTHQEGCTQGAAERECTHTHTHTLILVQCDPQSYSWIMVTQPIIKWHVINGKYSHVCKDCSFPHCPYGSLQLDQALVGVVGGVLRRRVMEMMEFKSRAYSTVAEGLLM